ncbi:MAG TPA: hypothetical protein PLD54_00560 [Candidatus Levybacteria bacterium]|nr:hypothetical protein [Candidatus Levybacteria bacterium]
MRREIPHDRFLQRTKSENEQAEEREVVDMIEIFNTYGGEEIENFQRKPKKRLKPKRRTNQNEVKRRRKYEENAEIELIIDQPVLLNLPVNSSDLQERMEQEVLLDFPRTDKSEHELDTIIDKSIHLVA